ncbi:bcl-2-interacting killer isoform X2 [Papio anubis]|nr:bcl-2-interacting killer isoform X2 [Papio anubis]XP_021777338.1 bcl-2-interacting killer isoform X2 [Papio anubis]XP_021777339.1 bcl-2-interacting killer isoform X2 [Papio anubis]XP_031512085.1 bcl-2-interacting killer isoform X2 [Papio anubis]
MSGVRPISRDILMETLLYEQLLEPLTMEVLGVTDPEEDLDPMEDFDPLECMEDSDMLALRLACIGDEMDVSLRAPRLAQLSEVAMHSLGLAFIYDQTDDIRDVLRSFMDGFTTLRENIMRFWRSPNPRSWVRALEIPDPDLLCGQWGLSELLLRAPQSPSLPVICCVIVVHIRLVP